MVLAIDLRDVREPAIGDTDGLASYLQQLLGEPFLFFRPSYADELTVHFGSLRQSHSPKLKKRMRGSYVLTTRGSIWVLLSGQAHSLTLAEPFIKFPANGCKKVELSDLEAVPPVKPGAQVVWAMPYQDELFGGFGLSLSFSDQSRLLLRPSPALHDKPDSESLPEIADWELFTPYERYVRVGPGHQWAYLPSTDEKATASGGPTP